MANKILTKSENFNTEYCCSIVKIGEVKPIENKDKIGYTIVNGETIVVRKDMVKEGDILFYASNETQLNKDFLSKNNLFESSSYELNSNAKFVEGHYKEKKSMEETVVALENLFQQLVKWAKFLISYDAQLVQSETKKIAELNSTYVTVCSNIAKKTKKQLDIRKNNINDFIVAAQERAVEIDYDIQKVKRDIEKNAEFIRDNVGFFNKTGRVRAIRLGGIQSMGYLFSLDELAKYNPNVKNINLDELVGEDFDTVDGELFIKAYVPFVPQRGSKGDGKSRDRKLNKKIEKFDRMIKGEFSFHYSTDPLPKCINRIKPTDVVTISFKLHGTSICIGNVHIKTPKKLPFHKLLWNKFVDFTGLFKKHRITDYIVEYGNVTSSRKVIKNQYINKDVNEGYYGIDIYTEYGNLMYPYLDEGMTIYGEIIGYVSGSEKMIQPEYDYGCNKGENKLMIYRITTTNDNGTKKEWNVFDVKNWTEKLIEEHPEIADRIHVIDIAYHGTLADLYPELSLTEHWHENVLEKMREDKKRFNMEKNCPFCVNKVPFEGIVLRIDDDDIAEAFKLKTKKFQKREAKLMDDIADGKEELSEEMAETYS